MTGHPESVRAIRENGLEVSGVRGNLSVRVEASERLNFTPDLAILATKTQDIRAAIKDNLEFVQSAIVLTTQNGVGADRIAAGCIPKKNIVSSIVMFGSTCLEPSKVVHNFDGSWIIGRAFEENDEAVSGLRSALSGAFSVEVSDDILGMKYLKIFVNANNCIPALLGQSMQEAFSDPRISRISIAIWKEGLDVVNKAGIKLVSLPDFPLERLVKLVSMPGDEAARVFSGIMTNLSKEPLYGSILQSIKRNRPSEIDYINGEFVNLAKDKRIPAPLNEKLVEMVHMVEARKKFFNKQELFDITKWLYN